MAELHLEQTYEKQLPAEVAAMVWSPKRDLIAFSLVSGGVALYRMTLHRVWTVEPPEEGTTVSALCWRPDGALLAVAYTSGQLVYLDLESGDVMHLETFSEGVTCLSWAQLETATGADGTAQSQAEGEGSDSEEEFLPPLASLSRQYGSASRQTDDESHDVRGIAGDGALTVLAVGTRDGSVTLLLHGLLLFGRHGCADGLVPRALAFSPDLSQLTVLADSAAGDAQAEPAAGALLRLELEALSGAAEPLRQLAALHGRLASHLAYLDRTIQAICEAWETVLVEMDAKMQKFQASLGDSSSLSVEFLELLLLGLPSPEMEQFLLNDLTDTGLKKLRHSIELSYTNIQALVLRHLQTVALRIADLLIQMAGMARFTEQYGALGLCEERVTAAQRAAGLFLVKATEMQQVIDSSTRNFQAFFRWLYGVILRLSENTVPPESAKLTPDHLTFIAQFIDTNLGDTATARGVHLERVGMYLRDAELELPAQTQQPNSWRRLLADNPALAAAPAVVAPDNANRSLLQERDALRAAVSQLLADTAAAGSRTLRAAGGPPPPTPPAQLAALSASVAVLARRHPARLYILPVTSPQAGGAVELEVAALLTGLGLPPPAGLVPQLRQVAFCTDTVVSALVTDAGPAMYLQLEVTGLAAGAVSAAELLAEPAAWAAARQLDSVAPVALAVSGARHLLAVLFKGGRRARVYDTADNEQDDSMLETTAGSANLTLEENKENVNMTSP